MTGFEFGCIAMALGLIYGALLKIARNQEKLFELFREWGEDTIKRERENVNGKVK